MIGHLAVAALLNITTVCSIASINKQNNLIAKIGQILFSGFYLTLSIINTIIAFGG